MKDTNVDMGLSQMNGIVCYFCREGFIRQALLLVYLTCMINNHIISMSQSQQRQVRPSIGKSGCYGSLKANKPDFQLPLKSFHYEVHIVQCFANVKLTQIYYNSSKQRLDVDYIFPVHSGATISSLEVSFAGKKIAGVIMEKEIAEKQFQQQVDQGTQAAYSEYNPKSRDVIKLKLGNIAQQQEIQVVMCYTHLNSLVCNTFYEFRLASTITPRYASQLDASKLFFGSKTQSRNMEGKCFWSVDVLIRSQRKIMKVESFTHKLLKKNKQDGMRVTFDGEYLPDKDFKLYYSLEDYQKPNCSISHSDNNTVAAVTFIPKYCELSIDDALQQAKAKKNFQVDLDSTKGQYIFLLDRSGSMGGVRIQNAKRSLQIFLRSLPDNNYFNVLSFGSRSQYLLQDSPKNTKEEIDKAVNSISSMDADMGGTEILMVLQDLVKRPTIPNHPRLLFFLTDGAVSNVSDVIEFVAKHTQNMRIYSIGIGNGCSEELIIGCAQKGKGCHTFITDDEKPQQKIINLLEKALSPVISHIQLEYDESKIESVVPNPKNMPFILKDDLANFYFSFNHKLTEVFKIKIQYKDSTGKTYNETIEIDPNGKCQGKWLHCLISYQKIRALCDTLQFSEPQQDRIYYFKKIDKQKLNEEIIQQSIKHQILTEYTAFLCVDASTADQIKQQASKRPKERVSLRGLNPHDHKVSFFNEKQGYNQDDQSECYINECCVASWEPPPKELEGIGKFEEVPKLAKQMPLKGRIAGKQNQYLTIPGIKSLPNPQNKLAYAFIVKIQQADGSWHNDFLDSLFTDAAELRKTFQELVEDKTEYLTFLVCQYLLRFYSNETQFSMIIKKGRNYVEKKARTKWAGLEAAFHRHYNPLQ